MTNETTHNGPHRVDLTSQDLRTGIIRLPRQLHGRFKAGPLAAAELNGKTTHALEFISPRELHGLQAFFQEHKLRTNDAILIHLESERVLLEPFYRNRRRSEVRSSRPSTEPTNRTDSVVAAEAEQLPAEAEPISAANESTTDSRLLAEPIAGETPAEVAPQEQSAEQGSGQVDSAAPDPEADAFDDFGDFDDLGELDPFDLDLDPTDYCEVAESGQAASASEQHEASPLAPRQQPFHVTDRRSFRLTPAAGAQATTPQAQPAATVDQTPPPESAISSQVTAADDADPLERVRRYLKQPGLPSILQERELAATLGLSPESVAEALTTISREPESRLGTIRTGFWLLKQPERD